MNKIKEAIFDKLNYITIKYTQNLRHFRWKLISWNFYGIPISRGIAQFFERWFKFLCMDRKIYWDFGILFSRGELTPPPLLLDRLLSISELEQLTIIDNSLQNKIKSWRLNFRTNYLMTLTSKIVSIISSTKCW